MDALTKSDAVASTARTVQLEGGGAAIPPVKTVALSTGVTLPYVERGDRDGVPVVLLHGITDSLRSFEPVLTHLPPSIRAFAVSQRGHGDAQRPAAGYRSRDFAADAAAFVDALGLSPAIVVGHSMGSTNALRLAIDFPQRVRALFLIGAFASYRTNAGLVEFWDNVVSRLTDPIEPAIAREFQESTLAQPVPPAIVDQAVQESLKMPARVWREAFAGLLEDDFTKELDRVSAPTVLYWGERDVLVPRFDQDRLLANIRNSRLVVCERAGHAPHWEEPARFAAEITEFAATTAHGASRSADSSPSLPK
jgi:pimeloyl-ACP methyl ester carboxylesterase